MTDIELLKSVLHCQQMLKAMGKPVDDESEIERYLRWAANEIAKRIWWDNRKPEN